MIPGPPAHPAATASVVSATVVNVGLRPHPRGGPPDTLLLARGMSSRYLSSKTEHRLLPLSRANVERNLQHCEAHRSTCGGYAQQRFVHGNRELAGDGHFGAFSVPPLATPIPPAGIDDDGDDDGGAVPASSSSSAPLTIAPQSSSSSLPSPSPSSAIEGGGGGGINVNITNTASNSPPSITFDATTSTTVVVLDVANITAAAGSDDPGAAAPLANATSGVVVVAVAPTSPEAGAVGASTNATAIIAGGGGGAEVGGGDDVVTALDPNNPSRSGNYTSRAIPCLGQDETSGLVGYATLSSLYDNVRDYHASFATDMPTHYPTGSHAPSTTTITPTYTPTATGSPSPLMEGPTTEAPTYAPITYRPTLFPTSSIREPKVPTRSPAPTIASAPPPPPNNHPKRKRVNRQCSHQNCDNRVVQGGVCVTHGTRRKCCAHPGCEKSVRHSGYCSAHGPSWQNATMPTPMMTTTMEAAAGTEEERGGDNNAMVIHHEVPPPMLGRLMLVSVLVRMVYNPTI